MPKESSQSILFPDCCRSQIALSKGNLLRCIVSRVPMLLTLLLPEWIEELCKVALTFESVDKILWCDHSNERSQSACTFTWYYLFFKILQNEIREFLCNLPFWPQLAVKGLNSLIPRASSRLFCFSCSRVLMLRASSQRSCPIGLNFTRLLRVVITPSVTCCWEEKTTRSNRMNFRLVVPFVLFLECWCSQRALSQGNLPCCPRRILIVHQVFPSKQF